MNAVGGSDRVDAALDSTLGDSSPPLAAPPAPTTRQRLVYLRDVTLHLVAREFATRHRGALLGWAWALAPPLLQLVVTYFLFTKVIPLGVANYPVFLLTGILSWNWFSRSVGAAVTSLETSRDLVRRPGFPTLVLPLVSVVTGLLDYLIARPAGSSQQC